MEQSKIAVLGVGGVGGFLSSLLAHAGNEVICLQKEELIPKGGLTLESAVFGKLKSFPRFTSRLDVAPDILFVATKAIDLPSAAGSLPRNLLKNSIIVPLLNGVDHIGFLRGFLGRRIAVGMVGAIEVRSPGPGLVLHSSPQIPLVELASADFPKEKLQELAEILRRAGLRSEVLEREEEVVWRKLVRLSAIAAATAAAQEPIGFVRSDPEWRRLLLGAVSEAAEVAKKEGIIILADEAIKQIDALPETLTMSLQADQKKGISGEKEAIVGAVLKRARRYGIPAPSFEHLYGMLI